MGTITAVILVIFTIICLIVCAIRDSNHAEKEEKFNKPLSEIIVEDIHDGRIDMYIDASDFPSNSEDAGNTRYDYKPYLGYYGSHEGKHLQKGECFAYFTVTKHSHWTSPSTKPVRKECVIRRIEISASADGFLWYDANICASEMRMGRLYVASIYISMEKLIEEHYRSTFHIKYDEKTKLESFLWDSSSFVFLFGLRIDCDVVDNKPLLRFSASYLYVVFMFDDIQDVIIHPDAGKYWLTEDVFLKLLNSHLKKVVCNFNSKEEVYERNTNNQIGYYIFIDKLGRINDASSKVKFRWNTKDDSSQCTEHTDYYSLMCGLTERFVELRDELSSLLPVFTAFQKKYPETICNLEDCFHTYMCMDAYRCYKGMGESMDIDSINETGLGVLIEHMISDKYSPSYDSFVRLKHIKKQLRDFLVTIDNQSSKIAQGELLVMPSVLAAHDVTLKNKYVDLLYEWSYTVATYDKYITKTERDFLVLLKNERQVHQVLGVPTITENASIGMSISKDDIFVNLNSLIGLDSVKDEIKSLANFIEIQNVRKDKGLKISKVSYHCVFTGNPGTGKTTVARLLADIYKNLGVLKKGHLVETDRSGLVAEYVGQTATKTNAVIDRALDGVLFIDEAYSLSEGGANDFGMEAITTLLKRMEDDRTRLVVILAGYSQNMETFINSNPGLQSRFNRYINFPDYSSDELFEIFMSLADKNEYYLNEDAKTKLKSIFNTRLKNKDTRFGNGRYVRNIFEKTIQKQADRLLESHSKSREDLVRILASDIVDLQMIE